MTTFLRWALYGSAGWVVYGTVTTMRSLSRAGYRRIWRYAGSAAIASWFIVLLVLAAGHLR